MNTLKKRETAKIDKNLEIEEGKYTPKDKNKPYWNITKFKTLEFNS